MNPARPEGWRVHGLVHRWFARGEGWAYAAALPPGLRDAAVAAMSRRLDSRDDADAEMELAPAVPDKAAAPGPATLFFRAVPDLDCPDPLARGRDPFVACGLVWLNAPAAARRGAAFRECLAACFAAAAAIAQSGPTPLLTWDTENPR